MMIVEKPEYLVNVLYSPRVIYPKPHSDHEGPYVIIGLNTGCRPLIMIVGSREYSSLKEP